MNRCFCMLYCSLYCSLYRSLHRSLCVSALCLMSLCALLGAAERPLRLAVANVDLESDASVRWGQLPNGLIYAIMQNDEPTDKVSLRLFVRVGSIQEEDNEQGLAHYLEHMGFNGSDSFPKAGQVIETLQGIGVAFGRDSNAHTGFDETVYKLDMPNTESKTIDLGLQVFSDWAAKLHNADDEVDNERGIILSEMRDRAGPQMRIWRALYQHAFAGMQLGYRFPIGTKESVETLPAERLRHFYKKWYRPDRMVLTIVGAIDPQDIEQRIHAQFASIAAAKADIIHPQYGQLKEGTGVNFYSHQEEEYAATFLYYSVTRENTWIADGRERRARALRQHIISSIMNRRLQTYVEDHSEGAVLSGGLNFSGRYGVDQVSISVSPKPGRILEAVSVLEQELRRMRAFGPTQQELEIAAKGVTATLKQSLANVENRTNKNLATELYTAVKNDSIFQTPEQNNQFTLKLLKSVTLEDLQKTIDESFNGGNHSFALLGRESLSGYDDNDNNQGDSAQQLQRAFEASVHVVLEKKKDEVVAEWAYAGVPDTKKQFSETAEISHLDHGIVSIACANHVHAAVLARDEKPNQILMNIRIAVANEAQRVGLDEAMAAYMDGGLGRHSAKELRSVLAGKRVRIAISAKAQAITIRGSCPPEELELMMQMARAWIIDGGWRQEGFERLQTSWVEALKAQTTDLAAVFSQRVTMLSTGGLARFRSATLAEAEAVTWQDVQAWARPVLAHGAIEMAIVGDVDAEKCTELIGKYFATLPDRHELRVVPDLTATGALRAIAPMESGSYRCQVQASVARAMIRVLWLTDDTADVHFARRMGLLSRVISDLLRKNIREKLGDAYSPYARHSGSREFDKMGHLFAQVSIAPERVDEVLPILRQVIAELLENGISDDLFQRVHVPALSSLPAYRQTNNYWLNQVVARAYTQPQRLQWAENMMRDMTAITKEELHELAKKYLQAEPLVVIAVSEGTEEKVEVKIETDGE